MIAQIFGFLEDEPPVIVDWLPWNHTFGGNHDVGIAIYNGGTFYIDDGKPGPGGIEKTVRNLREISTTVYFNVPKGYEDLLPFLRTDRELRESFFRRLGLMFYAGAGLSQPVWDAYRELASKTCGERIIMATGLDGDFPHVDPDHVGDRPRGNDRPADPRRGAEARPTRRQARSARSRA
jgi:feruloyl-CoA synthase